MKECSNFVHYSSDTGINIYMYLISNINITRLISVCQVEKQNVLIKITCFPATLISVQLLVNVLAPISAKWYELGTAFGFPRNDLEVIKQTKPHGPVIVWLTDMLDTKMNRSPKFGWSDVIQAVVSIGCGTLAESIQQEHYPQGEEKYQ